MTAPLQLSRVGWGGQLVGMPRRTRHFLTYSGVTLPTVHTDDYTGAPEELPTSEPGSVNYSHVYDGDDFFYPKVDGTQLTYLPYGSFRGVIWLGGKNDNAANCTVSVKVTTTINSDAQSSSSAFTSVAVTASYYWTLLVTWHPWAVQVGSDYPYRYTGHTSGDTIAVKVWASGASVKLHKASWCVSPYHHFGQPGDGYQGLVVAWPYNDLVFDLRTGSYGQGPRPTWGNSAAQGASVYPQGTTGFSTASYVGLACVGPSYLSSATARAFAPIDSGHWNSSTTPQATLSQSAVALSSCNTTALGIPSQTYWTGLPGRAACTYGYSPVLAGVG